METLDKILNILSDLHPEFNFSEPNIDFIENGYIDSFDLLIITEEIKSIFGIALKAEDIVKDNFRDTQSIKTIIEKYL